MIHELPADEFAIARPLFAQLSRLQVSAGAVLDGECLGRLVVDDRHLPTSALLTSPEGSFLAGDPDNRPFVDALRRYVWGDLFGKSGWSGLYVTTDQAPWEQSLAEIAAPRALIKAQRRHYECRSLSFNWRTALLDGFAVRQVDAALLDDQNLIVPDHLWSWIGNNWGSQERFLNRAFGTAIVHQQSVVSWSLADCRSGDACEIGIHTLPVYRRRGLATVTAAAAVEHALTGGYRVVGWHCNADNPGSSGTAERVGFRLERRYESIYFSAP